MSMTSETEQVYLLGNIPWDGTFVAACIAGLVESRPGPIGKRGSG
jgi:hypothetical protein